eukprot:Gb_11075 [translate_table: standard]
MWVPNPKKTTSQDQVGSLQVAMAKLTTQLQQPPVQQDVWCPPPCNAMGHSLNEHPDPNTQPPSQWCNICHTTSHDGMNRCQDSNNWGICPIEKSDSRLIYQKCKLVDYEYVDCPQNLDRDKHANFLIVIPDISESNDEEPPLPMNHQRQMSSITCVTHTYRNNLQHASMPTKRRM